VSSGSDIGTHQDLLDKFSMRSVDIETELDDWVSRFVEGDGRSPTAAETGKAHKTITTALKREPEATSAIARRRQLRNLAPDSNEP
jgi:hypothetical protein